MAVCFELTPLDGMDLKRFETFLWDEFLPNFEVLRRNVRNTTHRLFKVSGAQGTPRYIWLVFVGLVGSTPETAGDGPEVLSGDEDWLAKASLSLASRATISPFAEILPLAAEATA